MNAFLRRIRSLFDGRKIRQAILDFFCFPKFPGDQKAGGPTHTYRFHFLFILFHAVASGILTNTGLMATSGLNAEDWQLGIRMPLSSLGMFSTLFLGHWMVRRRKMPFVLTPGIGFAVATLLAAFLVFPTVSPFWFMFVLGIASAFEIMVRSSIATIVRLNYPEKHRGKAVGELRKWSSLIFLIATLLSAYAMTLTNRPDSWMPVSTRSMILIQLLVAGGVSLVSFFFFSRIRVLSFLAEQQPPTVPLSSNSAGSILTLGFETIRASLYILNRDRRFRTYLISCFFFGMTGLLYIPYLPFLLKNKHELGLTYLWSAVLLDIIPAGAAFLFTGLAGRILDRISPWLAWAWIRFLWCLSPLLFFLGAHWNATPGSGLFFILLLASLFHGVTMGVFWILWWRIGINHFAPTYEDTGPYLGIFVFQNGLTRILGPIVGGWIIQYLSLKYLFLVGGIGVFLSGVQAAWSWKNERHALQNSDISSLD